MGVLVGQYVNKWMFNINLHTESPPMSRLGLGLLGLGLGLGLGLPVGLLGLSLPFGPPGLGSAVSTTTLGQRFIIIVSIKCCCTVGGDL